jgi:signal transduction histidine kinase
VLHLHLGPVVPISLRAEQDQVRIFDRFERAVSARHFGGLGLGLYLVRWIVTSHGGSVRVESEPNGRRDVRRGAPLASAGGECLMRIRNTLPTVLIADVI